MRRTPISGRRGLALAVALGLLLPAPGAVARGQEPAEAFGVPGFEIERFSWVGAVPTGGEVRVLNRFGDLRARFGGYEDRLEVFANVQQFADEGAPLEVEVRETAAGVVVEVGSRDGDAGGLVTTPDPGQRKRADMVVYVPRGVPLSASTQDGLFDARGLESDVRARTVGGRITARKMVGALDFATASGDLLVVLERWDRARRHSLASESGDLSVVLGGDVHAAIRVATSGRISTDVSMTIDYRADRRPIRRGEARLGKGSSSLSIVSADGDVRLARRPLARKARVRPGTAVEP